MNSGSSPRAARYLLVRSVAPGPAPRSRGPARAVSPVPPDTRAVASTALPLARALITSTGPPGATCTMAKLTTMMPKSVGTIRSSRRAISASIALPGDVSLPWRQPRGLGRVDPPGVEAQLVLGRDGGAAEHVPRRHAEVLDVPVWDDVEAPEQHPVEGARPIHQALPVGGRDERLHEGVDDRILNAGEIAAPEHARARGRPVIDLFVARRERFGPEADDHVEVEAVLAVLVLRGVHGAHARGDAEALEVLGEGQGDALEGRLGEENLELEGRARAPVHELHVPHDPARALQQLQGGEKMIPDEAGAVGDGRLVLAGEDLLGDPSAKRGEDLQLARRGQAPRCQLGVREVALRPRVSAVEERAIRPLEVESVAERLAHPRVREDRAARVEDVALHPRGHLVLLLLDEPGGQGGAGVPCRPRLRRVLRTEVILSGLERLQGHGGV